MKTLHLLTAGALIFGFAGVASAQTIVRITGSTAFRAQTNVAILRALGSTDGATLPSTGANAGKFGYNGSDRVAAGLSTFEGVFQGQAIIVQTAFSGSNGGIENTAGSKQVQFHSLTTTLRNSLTPAGTAFGSSNPVTAGAVPDITMMDTEQAATPFLGNYLGTNYATLTETRVGVIPYRWVATTLAPQSGMTMTPLLAQAQWIGLGTLPLAVYTGNAAQRTTLVYATGRNADSGTRNAAFTESGIGATTTVRQYDPATGNLYSSNGNGGESSGGTLISKLVANQSQRIYVTYASINDTDTPVQNGTIRELGWNGVPYSEAAVVDGRYTFWTYQNLGYRSNYTGLGKEFADALAVRIIDEISPILLSEMQVTRPVDGGVVTPIY